MFGRAVAINGATARVDGSTPEDFYGVYVFDRTEDGWIESAFLLPADPAPFDSFAGNASVSIHADTAVVGSPGSLQTGQLPAAYVFERSQGTWTQTAKLQPSPSVQEFGTAVAVHGSTILVGAPGDDTAGSDFGAGFVYEKVDGQWLRTAKLCCSPKGVFARLGTSAAVDDDVAVLGGPVSGGGADAFRRGPSGGWSHEASLTDPNGGIFDRFGSAVGVNDEVILVGAPGHSSFGTNSGAAYVFRRIGGLWTLQAKLLGQGAGGMVKSCGWNSESIKRRVP
jgi:hypothetical protein